MDLPRVPDTTPSGRVIIIRDQPCVAQCGVKGIHQFREGYTLSHGAWRDHDVSTTDDRRTHTPEGLTNPPTHPVPPDRIAHASPHRYAQPDPALV